MPAVVVRWERGVGGCETESGQMEWMVRLGPKWT